MSHYNPPSRRSNGNIAVPAHVAHLQNAVAMEGGMYPHYIPSSEPYGVGAAMMTDEYGQPEMYMSTLNDPHSVFVPLPQAPRLPVAAARASALASMYYDPTLYPAQMHNPDATHFPGPWGQANAHGLAMQQAFVPQYPNPAAMQHHAHAEHHGAHQHAQQPMVEDHPTYNNAYAPQPFTAVAGSRSRSLAEPFVSRQDQGAFGIQARGPPGAPAYHATHDPSGAWGGARWSGANHFVDAAHAPVAHRHSYAPTSTASANHPAYNHGSVQGHNHANGAGHQNAGWQYRFNADMRRHWESQQQPQGPAQSAYGPTMPTDQRFYNDVHAGMQQGNSQPWQWNVGGARPQDPAWSTRQAIGEGDMAVEATHKPDVWQAPTAQQQDPYAQQRPMMAVDYAGNNQAQKIAGVADPNAAQKNAGPAPPSPGTLDKSAVPVSSVGAEIVWIAAAALLDPTLWLPNKEEVQNRLRSSSLSQRKRMASHGSSSDVSGSTLPTPMTSPVNTYHDEWHRQSSGHRRNVVELLEESSASSSEPGTPPTTLPSRIWEQREGEGHDAKRISLSALHGMRSLGLSSNEDSAMANSNMDRGSASPREMQSPRSRCFRRLESFDRSRETVTSVADLLSWDCKWSTNDDKLDSLRHCQAAGGVVSPVNGHLRVAPAMTRRTSSQNRMQREDPNSTVSTGLAMSTTEASPAFRRFTHQVLAQTLISPTAFMLGIMYSLRVLRLAIVVDHTGEASIDPMAAEIFASPPSAAPFKLFTLGMMIANKHLDDNTFLNKTWNEVTGIALPEINRAERWYLERCSYEITVPEETWIAFLRRMHERTEQRVNALNAAKRFRVPTAKQAPDAPRRHDQYVPPHAGSEEAQKRFLLCIEEALHALGYAPSFSLAEASSPLQHVEVSAPSAGPQRLTRPKKSLTHMHQHCHSAPVVGVENDVDVFDDEDGPYRPYRRTGSKAPKGDDDHANGAPSRNSIGSENVLSRSFSDSVPVIASSCAQEQHHRSCKADGLSLGDGNAPLAPSVLLELLNKGQHLAHVAS